MLTDFIQKKMKGARYKLLQDGSYFGSIAGLKGIWASAATRELCRRELQGVLEEWIILKLRAGERIPGLRFASSARSHTGARNYA